MTDKQIKELINHYKQEYKYCSENYEFVDDYLLFLKKEMGRLSLIVGECYQCGNERDFVVFYTDKHDGIRCFHCNTILSKENKV